jgi:hypothetical protein
MISNAARRALALTKDERPANPRVAVLFLLVKDKLGDDEEKQFSALLLTAITLGGIAVTMFYRKIKDMPDFDVPQGSATQERSWLGKTLDWVRDLLHKKDQPMDTQIPQGPTDVYPRVPFQPDEIGKGNRIDLSKVDKPIMSAIEEASAISGLSTATLYGVFNKESLLGRMTVATTSSARGLAQLTRGTFKEQANKYGKQYGIGANDYDNPRASAILGALYLRDMVGIFKRTVTAARPITLTELYLMYLLGASGGTRFIRGLIYNKEAPADVDMPQAAKNNPSVFYKTEGGKKVARSYREVYNNLYGAVEDIARDAAERFPQKISTSSIEKVSIAAVPVAVAQTPVTPVPEKLTVPAAPPKVDPSAPARAAAKAPVVAPDSPSASGGVLGGGKRKQPQDMAVTRNGQRVALQ